MNYNRLDLGDLHRLIQEFERLDKELPKRLLEFSDERVIEETLAARRKIVKFIESYTNIIADKQLTKKLKMIRDNKGYYIDIIHQYSHKESVQKNRSKSPRDNLAWIWFGRNYHKRKTKIGVINCNKPLPLTLSKHLDNIKECYSFGLYEAAICYCSNIINFLILDYLKKHCPAQYDIKCIISNDSCINILMEKSKDHLTNHDIVNMSIAVKEKADDILRSGGDDKTLSEEMAFDCIKETFMFIEYSI
jgi:hypothetical protein